jgi:glutamine synthetase
VSDKIRDFLELPYAELEELNLESKEKRLNRTPLDKLQEERLKYLTDEKRIKAVTVCFKVACICWIMTRSFWSNRLIT